MSTQQKHIWSQISSHVANELLYQKLSKPCLSTKFRLDLKGNDLIFADVLPRNRSLVSALDLRGRLSHCNDARDVKKFDRHGGDRL